jgi:uncharacterized protein YyaL (SSP411 family)
VTNITFNRLKDEKSAYLLQHKDNPVHWWPWGPEAIQRAKDENKPIFLSVGYSSCHWCHVMAHESFEDVETAELLNEKFICIKVDKEEMPDIDSYYQQACQLFTQSGGWPLSAFLLPDLRPYFAGTYFPKTAAAGSSSFTDILNELSRAFHEDKDNVQENASKVTKAIEDGFVSQEKVDFQGHFPPASSVMNALKEFEDQTHGGYGNAPKFPQFAFYEWALEQMLEGMLEKEQGEHIIKSLERMIMGGIYDHARGGIHRYSTDEKWLVPHFEKMLYDQAGFLRVLSKLSLLYPSPLVFDAIYNTLEYLSSEMLHDEKKYFFSAQDADSEGVEGLYFTYTESEFEDAIGRADSEEGTLAKELDKLKKWFGVSTKGNFDSGLNIVTLDPQYSEEYFTSEGWELVRRVRQALLMERKMRVPPMTDNKGVASWNVMMISALADVMQYCQVVPIKQSASNIFNQAVEGFFSNFINRKEQGMNIVHSTTKEMSLPYLEDYVFFAEAQLRTYELSGNEVFKQNFLDSMGYIKDQYLNGDHLLTRAKKAQDAELYPNDRYTNFDQSFKSASATYVGLVRKMALLTSDKDIVAEHKELMDRITHEVLKNPAGSGEALRALTYPDEAYKVLKCPLKWLDNDEFVGFISYFLPRFTFDYHEDGSEKWQICSMNQCELTDEGIESFIKNLRPTVPEGQVEANEEQKDN